MSQRGDRTKQGRAASRGARRALPRRRSGGSRHDPGERPDLPVRPGEPAPRRPPLLGPGRSLPNPDKASAEEAGGAAPRTGPAAALGGRELRWRGAHGAGADPGPLRRGADPTAGRRGAAGKGLSLSSHEGRIVPARSRCRKAGKEVGRAGLSPGRATPLKGAPRGAANRRFALLLRYRAGPGPPSRREHGSLPCGPKSGIPAGKRLSPYPRAEPPCGARHGKRGSPPRAPGSAAGTRGRAPPPRLVPAARTSLPTKACLELPAL